MLSGLGPLLFPLCESIHSAAVYVFFLCVFANFYSSFSLNKFDFLFCNSGFSSFFGIVLKLMSFWYV